jgi:sugar phosphate isomerase/epimerase
LEVGEVSKRDKWRLGFTLADWPCPEITDPVEHLKWHMAKTKELGGGVTQFWMPGNTFKWTQKILEEVKEQMVLTDNELELGGQIYGISLGFPDGSLIDSRRKEILEMLEPQMKAAKYLGVKIIRGSYGRLKIAYSRFNKSYPLKEHLKFIRDNLREAAKIFEDNDLYFAQENHCDFFGKEFAEIFAEVGSKHIGCTLDTANAYTVFTDTDEENEILAPYTLTVHVKDMLMEDFTSPYGLIPFQARGCAVGDGSVDIPRALDQLEKKSPFADNLHLVIEQSWMNCDKVDDKDEWDRICVRKGMKYLQKLLGRA